MSTKRIIGILVFALIMFLLALPGLAQDGGTAPAPTTPISLPHLLISVITPVVVWGISKVVPVIPRSWLPLLAPLVGALVQHLVDYVTGLNLTWLDGATAGGLGVFVREVVNQQVTKRIEAEDGDS